MKRKSMKKVFVMVLALAMVCVASVAGTLAYLSDQTEKVTNTFVIGSLFANPETDFALWEHKLVSSESDNGVFTLETGNELEKLTTSNNYSNVLPGVNVPKDPFVRVNGLKEEAYLFLVVEDNTGEYINITMDSNWQLYKTEADGKQIYVYKEAVDDYTLSPDAAQRDLGILQGNIVTVSENLTGGSGINISFQAYIIQSAGFDSYATAWDDVKSST